MRYVFFGTPRFAEIILDKLIRADMAPIALVCNPDRPVGRKKIVTIPPTKRRIEEEGIAVKDGIQILQPETLDTAFEEKLKGLHPDFFVVAAYAKIISKTVLDIPPRGTLGVHPSLLPKYRGASPIQSAILGGEKETGVTIYLMDEKMDHGPMLATNALPMAPDETYQQLEEKLANYAGELLIKTLPKFANDKIKGVIQNEAAATFTKKFTTEDGYVAPENVDEAENGTIEKAETIFRKIRALNPEPGVWTMRDNKRIKLLGAKITENRLVLLKVQEGGQKPKAPLSVRSDR